MKIVGTYHGPTSGGTDLVNNLKLILMMTKDIMYQNEAVITTTIDVAVETIDRLRPTSASVRNAVLRYCAISWAAEIGHVMFRTQNCM